MRRRDVITLLGGAITWPLAARAQPTGMPVIGFLNGASADGYAPFLAAFLEGLKETGFIDGQTTTIEYHWAEDQYERLPALAAELVNRQVAVIAATSTPAAVAAKSATSTIPVVFEMGTDPVQLGLVSSLNRPGGNLTGISNLTVDLGSKQLGLLRELVPRATAFAALLNPKFQGSQKQARDVETAARDLGLQLIVLRANTAPELETAFATMEQRGANGFVVGADAFFLAHRGEIVALAARHAMPAIYVDREFAVVGGLMSYGTNFRDAYRQAGIYTGRILRGEKPGDLPVQRSNKFELVINVRTAKALGLEVPNSMQLLADEVIE